MCNNATTLTLREYNSLHGSITVNSTHPSSPHFPLPCVNVIQITDAGSDVTDLMLTSTETSVMAALFILVFLSSLIANAFVFVVFCKRKSLSMSNRFVANLTICNCLNTLLIMPFAFVSLLAKEWIFGSTWCLCMGFFMNVCVSASIFTLAVISIDRYFAVVTPLHYTMRLTSKRCQAMIIIIWLAAFLVSSPPLIGWNEIRFQRDKMVCTVTWFNSSGTGRSYTFFLISSSFLLPLVAMLWTYARIFRAARRNSVRTRRNSVPRIHQSYYHHNHNNNNNNHNHNHSHSNNNSTSGNTTGSDDSSQTTPINGRRRSSAVPIIRRFSQSSSRTSSLLWRLEEWKTAVTSFLVLFTFALCWTPYFVVMAIEAGTGSQRPLRPPIALSTTILAMFSCACNPLVYVFRSKIVRKELKRIVKGSRAFQHEIYVPHDQHQTAAARRSSVLRNDSGRSLRSVDEVSDESGPLQPSTTASTIIPYV